MAIVTAQTKMIQVSIMFTMKQSIKKAMKVTMMMDFQNDNRIMRMKKYQMKMNSL